jgi:hypothetical protein
MDCGRMDGQMDFGQMDFDRIGSRVRREHGERGYGAAGQCAD